ncbi:type VI secretion system-associated FHA domain protein TagH [Aliikangiella coralliicola]|uniref:Type VI secretion system-associated FHA domain protein TagH n=1 Tax=Aliikangiella coralliicola TaxID=2592383 RepID=A0A545U8S5_9GAMM|nr:type VI secretion system-associated FHA domain protein TagH [Aliikangiella coralliicola]TQV85869.1 type VI secretion system-associated FHA domain protein TagH [Aliikangiella coralliicola]
MPIDIKIINSPGNVNVGKSYQTFSEEGGTIGRGPSNSWVLEDPEKYMSSVHTQISFEDGRYFLTDLSTNGTFINGSMEPIGKGNKIGLNEGDHFVISDYEFVVTINEISQSSEHLFEQPSSQATQFDPFAGTTSGTPENNSSADNHFISSSDDPFASPVNEPFAVTDSLAKFDEAETDPLAVLDKASSNNQSAFQNNAASDAGIVDNFSDAAFANSQSVDSGHSESGFADQGNVASDSIDWPKANVDSGLIPDDWDSDDLSESDTSGNQYFSQSPVNHHQENPSNISNRNNEADQSGNSATAVRNESEYLALENKALVLENKNLALENENQALMSEVKKLKRYIKKHAVGAKQTPQTSASVVDSPNIESSVEKTARKATLQDRTLIESMGLSKWNLDEERMTQTSETVGLLVRETLKGMMRVLKFRKKIKEEFRINVTTIQPVENNPLKFSANIDDAMENMFIKENNAYKKPVEAVIEGFQGIAEHQIAVLAGMQAAFQGMLDRLNPDTLESRFEKYQKSSLINLGQKGKNWESYKEYHKGLIDNLDDSFQHLFGYDFVQAYEDQMRRLVTEKLSKKKNGKK